jgi:mono/diheme cytochrome c family protein
MYRGIIQEGDWVKPGSYLRPVVEQNQLDKNFGRGRIWRLVHKDFKPGPQPRMLQEKPAQLVKHLAHPSGWWRDTAQKLLVLRGDKSVVPALTKMARSNPEHLARIHALWTLEGLDALDPSLVREKLNDKDPQVRIAAIRTSESLYKKGDHSLVPDVTALAKDPDVNVVLQALLTAELLKLPDWKRLLESTVAANQAYGVQKLIGPLVNGASVRAPAPVQDYTPEEKKRVAQGGIIYNQLCFTCHGPDGKGTPMQGGKPGETMAPPLGGSRTATGYRDGIINVVLKGLNGPVNGKNYTAQMVPMESNDDEWVAAVASYVRSHLGNHATLISPAEVANVRVAMKKRTEPWSLDELLATLPQPLTNQHQWNATASHNAPSARMAFDGDIKSRFDTGTPQVPGMWFQIELPKETEIAGLELDAADSDRDYPRGYKVELSGDGQHWGQPVATGHGTSPQTEIVFPTARAKFIRITQTGSVPGLFWSIHELQILKPGQPVKLGTATAKKTTGSAFE